MIKNITGRIMLVLSLTVFSVSVYAGIDSKQASGIATKKYPGKVLEVKRDTAAGKPAYRVKLVDKKSVVRNVYVDIATGKVVNK